MSLHLTTPTSEDVGLGFSLFARRYLGYHECCVPFARTYARTERNTYCSLFLLVLRCFTSQGSLQAGVTPLITVQHCRVSPFGDLRIKDYKPSPRSFSQVSRVLHSRPRPRHPPCTLMSLVRRPIYHTLFRTHFSPRRKRRGLFIYLFTYSYVKNRCLFSKRKPPQGAVFVCLVHPRPYGLSAPKSEVFRFVDT
ncbi:MAG: hypothetical protein RLZZ26_364 [Candidatus Parcubacteria bacterium]